MTVLLARLLPYAFGMLLPACADAAAAASGVPKPEQLAPDVYVVQGALENAAPANRGVVGNAGILIGATGVILVDTGTSARQARQLLADVREITDKPVVLAIDTHQNPAFVFGNGILRALGVPILAHRDTDALIAQRCMRCLKQLKEALGEQEMEGTDVVQPSQTIEQSASITVGGRTIDILYYGVTSSPGSIAVYDRASGMLFGGGLVSIDRIPDVKDADIGQWRAALRSLQKIGAARIVPGEGPACLPSRLSELDRYLEVLPQAVQVAFEGRASLGEAAAAAPVPAFRNWALYDSMHRKNVEQLYIRLEKSVLESP